MLKKLFNTIIITFFFLYACKNNNNANSTFKHSNLFTNDNIDQLLIPVNKNIQESILSPDSAYQKSSLVAICLPLTIDSFQQNNKTVFYVNTVKPLRILKGIHNNNSHINFISNTIPNFILHDSGWVIYVEPLQQKKLITQNYIEWQWLNNAPCHKTLF